MAPTNLAGLVVNGLDHTLAPNAVIRSSPSVDAIGWLREVDAVARMGVDDEQPVPAIEARGPVLWRDQESGGLAYRLPATSLRARKEQSRDSARWCGQEQRSSRYARSASTSS